MMISSPFLLVTIVGMTQLSTTCRRRTVSQRLRSSCRVSVDCGVRGLMLMNALRVIPYGSKKGSREVRERHRKARERRRRRLTTRPRHSGSFLKGRFLSGIHAILMMTGRYDFAGTRMLARTMLKLMWAVRLVVTLLLLLLVMLLSRIRCVVSALVSIAQTFLRRRTLFACGVCWSACSLMRRAGNLRRK